MFYTENLYDIELKLVYYRIGPEWIKSNIWSSPKRIICIQLGWISSGNNYVHNKGPNYIFKSRSSFIVTFFIVSLLFIIQQSGK